MRDGQRIVFFARKQPGNNPDGPPKLHVTSLLNKIESKQAAPLTEGDDRRRSSRRRGILGKWGDAQRLSPVYVHYAVARKRPPGFWEGDCPSRRDTETRQPIPETTLKTDTRRLGQTPSQAPRYFAVKIIISSTSSQTLTLYM